jgi:hypothetical protein
LRVFPGVLEIGLICVCFPGLFGENHLGEEVEKWVSESKKQKRKRRRRKLELQERRTGRRGV